MEGPTIMTEASIKVRPRPFGTLPPECVRGINSVAFSGGRSRYNDGPYNCNGGDGGKLKKKKKRLHDLFAASC